MRIVGSSHKRRIAMQHLLGLATTLSTYQHRHTLVSMQQIHMAPISHHRANPYTKKLQLFCGDTRKSTEQSGHMVLTILLRQMAEILVDRIIARHLFRVNILCYQLLRAVLVINISSPLFLNQKTGGYTGGQIKVPSRAEPLVNTSFPTKRDTKTFFSLLAPQVS